jgi:hypothetical protein
VAGRTARLYAAAAIVAVLRAAGRAKGRAPWLISGGAGLFYGDNGAALHRHIVEHHPDVDVYWVISKRSGDVDRARQIGPVLYAEDLKAYIYGLQAQVHVTSHGLGDVPGCGSRFARDAVRARLGHGLTALKRPTKDNFANIFDLVPVSSDFERQNKHTWGIDLDRMPITGLPRYDELLREDKTYRQQEGKPEMRILYMPTWRRWLTTGKGRIENTAFYRGVMDFLLHPGLNQFLTQHGILLSVHLHMGMNQYWDSIGQQLDSLNVEVLPPGTDLQDEIVRSRLLITDYSSVAWDFLYLDKPVLFFQFDLETFEEKQGAYIDLRKDLFGPAAYTPDRAVQLVKECVQSSFAYPDFLAKMNAWKAKAFHYHDRGNCARVMNAILKEIDSRQSHAR